MNLINNIAINKIVYIFAAIEPDKPLSDAQMVGSSLFIRLGIYNFSKK